MHGDWLDFALIVMAAVFAVSGYRQGFIVGLLSSLGFVGGAALGAAFGPGISRALVGGQTQQDVVAVILLVSGALTGQFVASALGTAIRNTMTGRSATAVDSAGGALVSMVAVLLMAWAIGSVITASPFPLIVQQVNDSAVLGTMNHLVPSSARTMFSGFRHQLAGPFSQVFSGIDQAHVLNVPAPDAAVLTSPGVVAARSRVVKIEGFAPGCDSQIEGSGFVYAPQHVMTDAHVVAGVTRPAPGGNGEGPMVITVGGERLSSRVVFYDPQIDIAVLDVPGLNLTPLRFAGPASPSDTAVVAGYPGNGPFTPVPARIGEVTQAEGTDIYLNAQVVRQVYEIRALVRDGNSGGPLLSPGGTVDGVVFAFLTTAGVHSGLVLTAQEVQPDATAGATATAQVSTQACEPRG